MITPKRTRKVLNKPPEWEAVTDYNKVLSDRHVISKDVFNHTVVSEIKVYMLVELLKSTHGIPGHIAEVGVYKGGTALLLYQHSQPSKELHLFDSFKGLQNLTEEDLLDGGEFADSKYDDVKKLFPRDRMVKFHVGLFPETSTEVLNKQFSFVHVDCDLYKCVLSCCEFFYPRLSIGGMLAFDDYGDIRMRGAKQAVDEFCAENDVSMIYLTTGQCFIVRHPW